MPRCLDGLLNATGSNDVYGNVDTLAIRGFEHFGSPFWVLAVVDEMCRSQLLGFLKLFVGRGCCYDRSAICMCNLEKSGTAHQRKGASQETNLNSITAHAASALRKHCHTRLKLEQAIEESLPSRSSSSE